MATVVREIERKYDAASGGTAALDAVNTMAGTAGVAAVPEQPEQLLDAIYYDTTDLRLIRAGITLRRRTGGEDAGWHLKPAVMTSGRHGETSASGRTEGRSSAEGMTVTYRVPAVVQAVPQIMISNGLGTCGPSCARSTLRARRS
jgi:CYTH domain